MLHYSLHYRVTLQAYYLTLTFRYTRQSVVLFDVDMEQSAHQHDAPDLICSMPEKRQRQEKFLASSSCPPLKLTNDRENMCFVNSVVTILQQTEVKDFLLTKMPELPNPAISTAQELARLYTAKEEQSAKQLCR